MSGRIRAMANNTSKRPLRTALPLALAIAAAACAPAVHAAVRECRPLLGGKIVEDRSELKAKQAALQDWLDKARQIGPEYTRWELAYDRRRSCDRGANAAYYCRAVGMPCAIKQVPPGNTVPLKKSQ